MERVTGLFTCVDNDSARSRRRARAWRAAREAGFACFVSGGGGGGSEEKTDHIVGRLRGQEGRVDGRVEEGLRRKVQKDLSKVKVQSSVSGSANSVTAQRPLRLVAQQRGAAVSTSRKLGALADAIFRRKADGAERPTTIYSLLDSMATESKKSTLDIESDLAAQRKKRAKTSTTVPVISLKPFFEGSAAGKQQVAEEWDRACREVGFLTIIDHGVPTEVIETMWKRTVAFFDQPLADKRSAPMTDDYPYGYQGMGMEVRAQEKKLQRIRSLPSFSCNRISRPRSASRTRRRRATSRRCSTCASARVKRPTRSF